MLVVIQTVFMHLAVQQKDLRRSVVEAGVDQLDLAGISAEQHDQNKVV